MVRPRLTPFRHLAGANLLRDGAAGVEAAARGWRERGRHVALQHLALAPPLDLAPFDVELGGCGVFPPSGPPRVIYIGLAQGLPSLAAMHEEFNRRLRPFGFEPEDRPFSAHLTLARIKDAPKGAGAPLREALRHIQPSGARAHVTSATVFQSHLSPKGPRYEALLHVPCRR